MATLPRSRYPAVVGVAAGVLAFAAYQYFQEPAVVISAHGTYDASRYVTVEDIADTPAVLRERAKEQLAALKKEKVMHDFRFTDIQPSSGITFRNHIVPIWPVTSPYDHLSSIAAADIDGDGRVDVFITSPIGKGALYRNLGHDRFEDITVAAGVGELGGVPAAAAFADMDNDGYPDLLVSTMRGGLRYFHNDGTGRFTGIGDAAGFGMLRDKSISGVVPVDYNNDGRLDLLVTSTGKFTEDKKYYGTDIFIPIKDPVLWYRAKENEESAYLFENKGDGAFVNVAPAKGISKALWSGDASFSDLNGDGYPDFYILSMDGDDHYYENEKGARFVDKTAELFGKTPWGSMGVKFFDFNNDGKMDLYVTDMHSDMTPAQPPSSLREKLKTETHASAADETRNNIHGNALYRNDGASFSEVSGPMGAETFWPWGPSVGDLNADGYEDVFMSSGMGALYWYAINPVLLNEGGQRFVNAEFGLGVEPRRDGKYKTPDLADTGYGKVPAVLSTRSAVIFDMDGDGDLDIITNDADAYPQVLVSDLAQRHAIHYLEISLVGTISNRDGLGATVTVEAGGARYLRYNDGKSGYLAQSVLPLYFGLGSATRVDRITIRWPSGITQTLTDVAANQPLRVTERR